jgi:hypothetical protein
MKGVFKKWWLPPVIVAGMLIGVFGWRFFSSPALAAECNQESIKCLQAHYYNLTIEGGSAAALQTLKQETTTKQYTRNNCHQATHAIGRAAAILYPKLEDAYAHGDGFCFAGYYHGVMETIVNRFGYSNIDKRITTVCSTYRKNQNQDHYNCVHGLGHGLMAINGNDLPASLRICDHFKDSWESSACYSGVFMENIASEINQGHPTSYLKTGQPLYPCTDVADKYKTECYANQMLHVTRVVNNDYSKMFQLCEAAGSFQQTCNMSVGQSVSASTDSEINQTKSLCLLPESDGTKSDCIAGAVRDYVTFYGNGDRATQLCAILEGEMKDTCESNLHYVGASRNN